MNRIFSSAVCTKAKYLKGFNLVEAAIVLGVVGLVIGGIWVAASAVRLELKTNQIFTGILATENIARPIITLNVVNTATSDVFTLTRSILAGKIDGFSGNAVDLSGRDHAIGTPLGSGSYLILEADAAPGEQAFVVTMGTFPKSICLRLMNKFKGLIQKDTGGNQFVAITTGNPSYSGMYMTAKYTFDGITRLDSDDAMCPDDQVEIKFYFTPSIN